MEQEPKSENIENDSDIKEKAFTHLAQGKRHLLVKDYNEAVTSLAMACTLLSKLYGELANECGEAYFNYGKALLELARTENGVLGIEGEREESQDSDDGEGEDDGEEEKESNTADSEGNNTENGKTEDENKEKDSENDSKPEDGSGDTKADETDGKEKEDQEEEDEDVDNLHLAWEMLEMAKVVFQRQAEDNKQINLKLAEVHLKLGEVSLESENYPQGIEEIKTCLDIQLNNLDKHDRYIAETHYQLGVAYSLSNEFEKAVEQYNLAHELLKKRIEYLQEREKQGGTNEENESNPFYSIKEEIAEINALLPEVKEKISDVEDYKKEAMKALLAGLVAKKEDGGESSAAGQGTSAGSSSSKATAFPSDSGSSAKPVSDISHLVRKKRKLESDSSEDKSSKQHCPDASKPE